MTTLDGVHWVRDSPRHLHPADAHARWMAEKIPSDQFLLYCFDGTRGDIEPIVEGLRGRSALISVLDERVVDSPLGLRYPRWIGATSPPDPISVHDAGGTWAECLEEIARSFERQVDPEVCVWRLHLYPNITDAPRCTGSALVAVLQLSHAAADGGLAAKIARDLFGTHPLPRPGKRRESSRTVSVTSAIVAAAALPVSAALMVLHGVRARRDALRLEQAGDSGAIPPSGSPRPVTALDIAPSGRTSLRTIVLDRHALRLEGVTITVTVMTAISRAMQRLLGDPSDLAAEVGIAREARAQARNNYGNVGVGLFPTEPDLRQRSLLIAAELAAQRTRSVHPYVAAARSSQDAAERHVPAFLAKWGVAQFDPTEVPSSVTGNTVVSSVSRGAADLALGGGRVRFTAGFPALSPAMSLTHGVHGIGDIVTVSITSNSAAVPDPDHYATLLRDAIEEVRAAST